MRRRGDACFEKGIALEARLNRCRLPVRGAGSFFGETRDGAFEHEIVDGSHKVCFSGPHRAVALEGMGRNQIDDLFREPGFGSDDRAGEGVP